MSIFGPKREFVPKEIEKEQIKELTVQINRLISRQLTSVKVEQSTLYNTVSTLVGNLNTRIDKLKNKRIITIVAESKGALRKNEMFSFGNGGKEDGVGYTIIFPGRLIGIGLSTKCSTGKVGVKVGRIKVGKNAYYVIGDPETPEDDKFKDVFAVTEVDHPPSDVDCTATKTNYSYLENPVILLAGDIIYFKSLYVNNTAENTVVSAIIEIDIDT